MADRYWVGGAGTWNATITTNWSASSGGAGGASAPTSADNVIFNSSSNATAYAVTVGTNANAADVTIAGPLVGNVTITSAATSVINCYGSWLSSATGVVFTTTTGAILNFLATTTGKTVTTNNVTLGAMAVTFNGVGGGWTLGSAFTHTNVITVTAGSFNTGNYNLGSGGFSSSGTGVRSVTLGSSPLALTGTAAWTFTTTTNLTFDAGTSTITCSGASPTFAGGALTYSTVSFTSTGSGTTTIAGANTFTTLSQATVASAAIRVVSIGANQTVSGTLTLSNGAAANRRMFVRSDTVGTSRTLTVATLAALVDVDFRDIVAAGASSPWSGTRLGNCRNNTNITFGAGVDKYWSTAAGVSASWSGTAWATSSGGTAAVNNFPLAQDTCIIDDAGATTGNGLRTGNTVTIDASWNMGTLNFSGRTVAFNWTQGNQDPIIYGNVTLTSSMTMTTVAGTPTWTFAGAGLTQTVDSAGITLRLDNFIINSLGGTVSLVSNTTVELIALTDGTSTLTQGTLSLGSFTLTTVFFTVSASTTRTLAFGTGKIVATGNNATVCSTNTGTGLTVTGSKRVELSYSGSTGTRTIQGATNATVIEGTNLLDYFITAGSDIVSFTASRNYATVDFSNGGTSTFTGTWINATATTNVYGNLILNSAMVVGSGAEIISMKATSGTKTITSAGQTIDFPLNINGLGGTFACSDALTLGSTRALTMTNGTLQLKAGTTSTVGSFVTTGTTLTYLQSTIPGTQATISDASGTDSVTYLSVQDSNATGGATWDATDPTNVYVTNNTGWNFGTLAALSGAQATGAVGSVGFANAYAVSGVQATGSVGSTEFANAYELSSVLSTTDVGSLISSLTVATTGVQATGAVGSVGFANAYVLSGVQATGSVGSVGFANAYTLSGVQATGEVGNVYTGWYIIPTTQTPAWTSLSTTQTPAWTSLSTTQTPTWTNIIQS